MKIVIIGGGVIGLSCAYELQKRGAEVTVLEARELGRAASWGNGGWIVPSLSGPVPGPGLIGTSARWLLQPDSPLYIKPRLNPSFLAWMLAFTRHCTTRAYHSGLEAMIVLNGRTMALFDTWKQEGIPFEMHSQGLLFACLTEKYLHHAVENFEILSYFGYSRPEILQGSDLHDLAPILSRAVRGGYLIESDRHVEPWSLTQGLAATLRAGGAELRERVSVSSFHRQNGHIVAVETEEGRVVGDAFLLAAGAWSGDLARAAGFRLPMESGKGYSITISKPNIQLQHPLYLGESRIGVSPFDTSLRVAGTMELSGISEELNPRRLSAMRKGASQYLTSWPRGEGEIEWAGMRPLTPDGLPALGRAPHGDNLFVATGHSMLGITLAPATGAAMAELVCTGRTEVDLSPFDPERFSYRYARADR